MKDSRWWQRLNWFSVFALLVGIIFLFNSLSLLQIAGTKQDSLGPGGFPLVVSVLWVVALMGIIVYELIRGKAVYSYKINLREINTIRWSIVILLILIYVFVVEKLGFIITSTIFVAILTIALGMTKKTTILIMVIASVAFAVSLYYLAGMIFHIPLPGEV